jgi:hypothetical protein
MDFLMTNRREFLQASAALAVTTIVFPGFRIEPESRFVFFDMKSGDQWPVVDPVQWALANRDQPILSRAAERLATLTADDGERIVRLILRRCSLNLVELKPDKVVFHHWGIQKKVDLRPFMKSHKLTRAEVEVLLRNRKNNRDLIKSGEDFLYGEPLANNFDRNLFLEKWKLRKTAEVGDATTVAVDNFSQSAWSFFCWPGLPANCIPWSAMKSAWRNDNGADSVCRNCDQKMLLVNFYWRAVGFYKFGFYTKYACLACNREFGTSPHAKNWLETHLGPEMVSQISQKRFTPISGAKNRVGNQE